MINQNVALEPIAAAEGAIVVDQVSYLVPCQRFHIRATVTKDMQLPLVMEYALRFLHIVGKASIDDLGAFFGLAPSELAVLASDLLRSGYVVERDGSLMLSQSGREAFAGTGDELNIVRVEEIDDVVAFDLVAFCLAEWRGMPPKYFKALVELPIQDRESASRAYEVVRESFERHFREYCQLRRNRNGLDERMRIHTVDEVEPKARYTMELTVPVQLTLDGALQIEPDFSALRSKGRPGSREPLVAAATRLLSAIQSPENAEAALDLVAEFDRGLLTRFRTDNFDPANWARYVLSGRRPKEDYAPCELFVGSAATQTVRRVITDWTKSLELPERDTSLPLIWVRPDVSHWGRNADFFVLLSDLSERYAEEGGTALLAAVDDPRRDSRDLRRSFGPEKASDAASFDRGIAIPTGRLPGALEMVLDPGRWVLVLVHYPLPESGSSFPIPVGFCSANRQTVDAAHKALSFIITKVINDAHVMWRLVEETDDNARAAIKAAFTIVES